MKPFQNIINIEAFHLLIHLFCKIFIFNAIRCIFSKPQSYGKKYERNE